MQFGLKISGHVYKLDGDENYLYFDIEKFYDKFVDFIESQGMYFGGVFTRVDLSIADDEVATDAELHQESLDIVAPQAKELVVEFYNRLFTEHPKLRPMFPAD